MNFVDELVSVVIPVYNTAPYLRACLDSVKNQSYKNLEIIVINDGSTDNSVEIIKEYVESDNRFILYEQSNHGLGYTRNKGIQLSTGEYIFFLDADDKLPKNAILHLLKAIKNSDVDYAAGKILRFNNERKYVPKRHHEYKLYTKNMTVHLSEHPELLQDSVACNKLWKKKFIVKNQLSFTEGRYYEDLNFTLKAAVLAKKIAIIKNEVYLWRVRDNGGPSSITQQNMRLQNTLDRIDALEQSRKWLMSQDVPTSIIEEYDRKCLIDILRLHVTKYALVEQTERNEWENRVYRFVSEIPEKSAETLPEVEKILHELVKDKNYVDLDLFSQMYLNMETEQLVIQENQSFHFKGRNRTYEISSFIKPKVIVKSIEIDNKRWFLNGSLTIPKASKHFSGYLYAINRNDNKKVMIGELKAIPSRQHEIYPYMYQNFEIKLDSKLLANSKWNATFDFYYKLNGIDAKFRRSRVRMSPSLTNSYTIRDGNMTFELYQTKLNNLSIKVIRDKGIFLKLLSKIKLAFSKRVR